MNQTPYIVAFDCRSIAEAEALADQLSPDLCRAKVGKELFTACGMPVVDMLHAKGYEVFLDLKFHDIPNTVAGAIAVAASAGVWMINVHASGGRSMMGAARESIDKLNAKTLLIAVTLLTSIGEQDLALLGIQGSIPDHVRGLAIAARESGLNGVVCSAQEASMLRESCGKEFLLVTPGIRPANSIGDDQTRVMTPLKAIQAGSDYLVVGRPITQAAEPRAALEGLLEQLAV